MSRERFLFEAEITANLEHPGIVPVHGRGTYADGRPFYAMRLIRGEELATAIRRFHAADSIDFAGREFRWLLQRFNDVCNTIAYAHSRGILHRDLKPANIMLGPFGETLVMDWGVATPMGQTETGAGVSVGSEAGRRRPWHQSCSPSVTPTLQAVGTPTYMSPEQAAGDFDELGPASDVYSLGATLYVLLTDQRPFQGAVEDVLQAVRQGRFPAPRQIQPRVRGPWTPSAGGRWRCSLPNDTSRLWPWGRTSSVGWRMSPSWPGASHGRIAARRWIRRHRPHRGRLGRGRRSHFSGDGLVVPLLSLAWRTSRRRVGANAEQRLVALQRAREAQEQRVGTGPCVPGDRGNERGPKRALKFLVAAFRKPDPAADGRTLKVVDLLDSAVNDLESRWTISH